MFNPGCHRRCLHLFYPKVARAYKVPESTIEPRGSPSLIRPSLLFLCEPSEFLVAGLLNSPGGGFVCSRDFPTCVLRPVSSSSPTTILPSLGTLIH
ncbi:hypothetical protein GYMLUDRAFT_916905 [Collybiopsis luxurians FD-317 M1]|uniref:Uncharacterized protein n=1 Tax=Collybiopsis luxurians FD-317 M1 TaxID=944289 RepID=A0A0D0C8H9_9AGAR|nr:hypothetical protein GYMLUDRAFT_916905 [Collybiopsis luxurians FD-317 M1]